MKKGGGFFERVRQLQATLTRIFIVLESESHGLSEIETDFSAKIGNSNGFSAQKQLIAKKKVFTEIETDFSAKIGYSNGFLSRITATTSQPRHPNSFRGGCFHFFTKNRPQKHHNRAILHTLQANASVNPQLNTPSGYATGCT